MTVPTGQPAHDLSAMLATLLAEGYSVSFALHPTAACVANLTGPLGSHAPGLGDTPVAALASVWPLGDLQDDDGQDDDVIDGPAVAAVARKVTALREYIGAALAGAVSGRAALERVGAELAGIGALLAADPEVIEDGPGDELEMYCRTCGHWIGHFLGLDGWQHFQGEPAAGGQRTLYDAGHEADPAWCVPPGRSLAPADMTIVRQALADACSWQPHRDELGGGNGHAACAALLGRLAAYRAGDGL
jgi:hypothetical protein